MNIVKVSTEHYRTVGDPLSADVIVGFSYDQSPDKLSAIDVELGNLAVGFANSGATAQNDSHGIPIIGDGAFVKSISFLERVSPSNVEQSGPRHAIEEVGLAAVGSAISRNLDIYTTLRGAKQYLADHDLSSPLFVAHARNIGQITRAAERLELGNIIIPPGLPDFFDGMAQQASRRTKFRWMMRNAIDRLLRRDE